MLVQDIMRGGQVMQSAAVPSVLRVGLGNLAASVSFNLMLSVSGVGLSASWSWRDELPTIIC